ncbi:MAG: acyl-CoA synthetase FdrA [Bacillota bacterium]
MFKRLVIKPNSYYDSIVLMRLARKVRNIDDVVEAQVGMATDLNKDAVREMGFSSEELEAATPNDLVIAVVAEDEGALDSAERAINEGLEGSVKREETGEKAEKTYATLSEAAAAGDAGIAAISVPGEYAAREAREALASGLHVFLFSDNVSIEDEIRLKKLGKENGLLVMGPDCGTAVIGGVGLGFANKVRPGRIGLVAAAGTGLQQVMSVIDSLGEGISEAIGTGGRDLSEEVGGITTFMGLALLESDSNTAVKVVISKPPHPSVRDNLIRALEDGSKPAVVCFMGEDVKAQRSESGKVLFAGDLEETAVLACRLTSGEGKERLHSDSELDELAYRLARTIDGEGFLRGLYSGGTLCHETLTILRRAGIDAYSNIAQDKEFLLTNPLESVAHTCIDMGEDYFTRGKPHPMLEPGLRIPRHIEEARHEDVGILLFDLVLGYGSHPNPAGVTAEAVKEARRIREDMGKGLVQIAVIVGTAGDPQDVEKQAGILREAGAEVLFSNRAATELVARIIKERGGARPCLR